MSLPKKKKNELVEIKKHVNAIHSSNNISLVQRKVFNVLLYNAYHDLLKQSQFEIPIKSLAELIGYDSHDHRKLKNSLLGLITTAIEWNVLDSTDEDSSKWRASSIIASAKIDKGMCTYEFSTIMREVLYHPEKYGRVDMTIMTKFKSAYGLALYENCIRFQGLSTTGWISLSVFRKLMGIVDGSYSAFCDFKKRVLDIALKEVNEHSHLIVIPEIQRLNRKVTGIRFKLSPKKQEMIHVEHCKGLQDDEINNILHQDFNLSVESIKEVVFNYDQDYIKEKIRLIKESDSFKFGKVRDLAAYLVDALKRDYKKSKSSKKLTSTSRVLQLEEDVQQSKIMEKKKKYYSKYVSNFVDQYLTSLTEETKSQLLKDFEQNCDAYALAKYRKHGLKNAIVKAIFNMFIKNKELSGEKMLSFEEFLQQTS